MLKSRVKYPDSSDVYDLLMADEQTMGDRIKMLRLSRGLSQEELGEVLGVSGPAIWAWENGNTKNLKLENFFRLCHYFQAKQEWLAFGDRGPPWDNEGKSSKAR